MRRIPRFVLLRAFEAAARLESFTLAALELHLTQSAISHQVRKLEDHFGRALFIRRNRRVELTPEGRRLLKSLTRAFDVVEAACGEVTLAPDAQVLALYCSPSLATKWLGPMLPEFMQAHPGIAIRLTSGAEPADLTRMRELDIAISYGPAPEQPGIVSIALGAEHIAPMCAPALLRPDVPLRRQAGRLPLIESQLSKITWADWFALNGLAAPPRPSASFDRASLAISAAVDGLGVILESTRLAGPDLADGLLVELGPNEFRPIMQETHFLSYRGGEQRTRKIRTGCNWILEKAGVPGLD